MKQQQYESVVLINATLEDEQIDAIINRIKESITTHGGELIEVDKWGRKRLAYPVQKSKTGYYVVLRFVSDTSLIAIYERGLRLDETVIRYLTIALDKEAIEAIAKQKLKVANEIAQAEAAAVAEEAAQLAAAQETATQETPAVDEPKES
ncbi:MAG: 30S ribosomal protein S6 [Melioribacteraceae bacterium]|nr:30S ribosomal protein S6 [Melioribacteraceae bacterium]